MFLEELEKGKRGINQGLPTGLDKLDRAMGGVQRKSMTGIAAAPKVGKTTLTDFAFVLNPILYALENNIDINYDYFSYEIDRKKKEFDFAAFFLYNDYGLTHFVHKEKEYPISSRYLMSKMLDHDNELIIIQEEHEKLLHSIYENRIVKLFGRYNDYDKKIEEGIIDFMDYRENPTGMRNHLINKAMKEGKFMYQEFTVNQNGKMIKKKYPVSYKPDNPEKYRVVITDHLRKLKRERGYSMKENVDKWIEYNVELRNLCEWTFVNIIHLNRGISNVDRLKYNGEFVYPTGDDVKDTGNLSEECDYLLTMMNPADEKYGLKKHFGVNLHEVENYRSIHLVESRDTECPMHLQAQIVGSQKYFKQL